MAATSRPNVAVAAPDTERAANMLAASRPNWATAAATTVRRVTTVADSPPSGASPTAFTRRAPTTAAPSAPNVTVAEPDTVAMPQLATGKVMSSSPMGMVNTSPISIALALIVPEKPKLPLLCADQVLKCV